MTAPRPDPQPDPLAALYQDAARAIALGLAINAGLAVVKLIAGLLGHSLAMVADAANSFADSFTSLGTLLALRIAQKPGDDNHPYGHSRVEAVAALTVAVVVAASAVAIGVQAFTHLAAPHPKPPAWLLAIAAANVVIKEAVFRYKRRVSQRTGSAALLAVAWDHRSDALCSAAVLVGLAVVRFAGPDYIWADEAAALLVVALILYAAVRLYLTTASSLMDEQCDPHTLDAIRTAAQKTPGVVAVEKLFARRSGLEALVDLHLEVDPTLTVEQGHRIGHAAQRNVLAAVPHVTAVLVHVEPDRPTT